MKLKKINPILLLAVLLGPLMLAGLIVLFTAMNAVSPLSMWVFWSLILLVVSLLAVPGILFSTGKKKALERLAAQGFHPNNTFTGHGCTIYLDQQRGEIAIRFKYNPFEEFILDASALTDAHTETGMAGKGIMEGTSRVRFVFTVAGMTFKIITFSSNRRYGPNSSYVLDGISKADLMVEALKAAKATAEMRKAGEST